MASDDINKSSNLKVPPLRIVINNNNNNNNSSITSGTNGSASNATNNFSGVDVDATDLETVTSVTNLNVVPGSSNSIAAKLKASTSNSTNSVFDASIVHSATSYSAPPNNSTSSYNLGNTTSEFRLDSNNDSSIIRDNSTTCLGTTQRITRSSQRAAQQNRSDIQTDHPMTSADDQISNSENIDRGNEQSRKTKKRKGESPENDQDSSASTASSSNTNQQLSLYQPPAQNSFQLYKNIRNQVDKRIKSLNCVHPKTPHGFKDYLLNRGVYLLNGNKLGNGSIATNNKNNEILIRGNVPLLNNSNVRIQQSSYYVVPEQVKAPGSLAISSPLHQLFIEQEKARHKMRMHHIKEREKLTLSAEQEILRVYNQAALAAANQLEPFSVCTLLKHQEIYNYIETDELSHATSQQPQALAVSENTANSESDGSSPETNRACNEKNNKDNDGSSNKESTSAMPMDTTSSILEPRQEPKENTSDISMEVDQPSKSASTTNPGDCTWNSDPTSATATRGHESNITRASSGDSEDVSVTVSSDDSKSKKKEELEEKKPIYLDVPEQENSTREGVTQSVETSGSADHKTHAEVKKESQDSTSTPDGKFGSNTKSSDINVDKSILTLSSAQSSSPLSDGGISNKTAPLSKHTGVTINVISDNQTNNAETTSTISTSTGILKSVDTTNQSSSDSVGENGDKSTQEEPMITDEEELSDDARSIYNKKIFFGRLQDIDDKWERIKCEMLIRHKNEAESLYAVQKLEWEWKAKEIGVCDVRTTPTIEQIYVPKVDVITLDY